MSEIEPFEPFDSNIRKVWDQETGEWWYAVVDVIEVLTGTDVPSRYWNDLRRRSKAQGVELYDFCVKFPMKSRKNNRTYQTDCSNQEGMLRIIQSIPSNKAEPIKQWLAQTGSRRLDEIQRDSLEAEREKYRRLGYDEEWINARIGSISVRNELTDEWENRGIEGREYGILTNTIHKGAFDVGTKQHKDLKGVDKGNLRDHMTPTELAISILGEAGTTEIIREENAQGYRENLDAAHRGGQAAGAARKAFEETSGKKVVSNKSYIEERKRLLAHGTVGKCDSCQNPVRESQTYGTEAGNLCEGCFVAAVERGEINEDGEIL